MALVEADMARRPGLFLRAAAAWELLKGNQVDLTQWFGPLEPLPPVAPPDVAGRRFDYAPAFNLQTQPRAVDGRGEARIPFWQLRALADNYDVLRLVIETRKDQMKSLEWTIQARDETRRKEGDARVAAATAFFGRPDGETDWDNWLGALLEDLFVIDAPAIYPRRLRSGAIAAFEVIDGATIKPVIDDRGRRPAPPAPAFQQVLHGLPAVDYAAVPDRADGVSTFSADQLYYLPRNARSAWVYGFSPVEQIVMTVNIALRRQMHMLQYYTEGTVPDALCAVPDGWSIDQIGQFQAYWDTLLTDNLAQRRKIRFVPSAISKGFVQTKEQALKDETDEWLARVVSFAFSISPQWAVKQMNRASAEQANEQALEEGLQPSKQWVRQTINRLLAARGESDLEFVWSQPEDMDAKSQSDMFLAQLEKGAMTLDEFRAEMGNPPYPGGIGSKPLIFTQGGAVLLETLVAAPDPASGAGAPENAQERDPAGAADGTEKSSEAVFEGSPAGVQRGSGTAAAALAKAASLRPPARPLGGPALVANGALAMVWSRMLAREGERLAAAALAGRKLAKAGGDDGAEPGFELDPAAWEDAETKSRDILTGLAAEAASGSILRAGLADDGITALAHPLAVDWAKDHAARFVAQIADTTRARLRDLVTQSETEGWPVQTLADAIAADPAFSAARAQRIALHETRTADNEGALAGMKAAKATGVATEKHWEPRGDNVCPACEANESDGWIDVDDAFSAGGDTAPLHVNCECDVEYRVKERP